MPVDEMKIFFHQTWLQMADTFNATQDENDRTMKDFMIILQIRTEENVWLF
jgi:hypothetical protein